MMLSFIGYILLLMFEYVLGIMILRRIFPDMRNDTVGFKYLFQLLCLLVGVLCVWDYSYSLIANGAIVVLGCIVAGVYALFHRVSFGKIWLWQIAFYTNLSLLKMPILIIGGILKQKNLGQVNRGERNIYEVMWCFIIHILLIIILLRIDKIKNIFIELLHRKIGLFAFCTVLQWSLLSYNMWLGEQGFQTIDLVINLVLIICTALSMQCFALYIAYQTHEEEMRRLDTAQLLIKDYNEELKELYRQNRCQVHDVKHHMLHIVSCLEKGDISQARESAEAYLYGLDRAGQQIWTGHSFLDFLLNYKKLVMDENNILFSLELDLLTYPFEDAELGVVLGNLLDNAIEAATKCTIGRRKIELSLRNQNKMFILELRNSSAEMPRQSNGKFLSMKTDRNAHGFGIENVKRIVDKHKGNIDFQYDSEHFEVIILI